MSSCSEIRKVLATSGEPMRPRDICDALGCEGEKERKSVYASLAVMAKDKAGVEKLDDGRYSLIPGWKPKRAAKPIPHTQMPRKPEPLGPVVAIDTGGCAPPVIAGPTVVDRITEYLRGDADYNVLKLLREARDELLKREAQLESSPA